METISERGPERELPLWVAEEQQPPLPCLDLGAQDAQGGGRQLDLSAGPAIHYLQAHPSLSSSVREMVAFLISPILLSAMDAWIVPSCH